MDGTLEQPAHTNDETLTGYAENVFLFFTFLYHVVFVWILMTKKMIVCLN